MNNDLSCRQAQRLMQRLLDRQWTRPLPPRLREHLETCQPCHTWQCLFHYEPADIPEVLPAHFAEQVVLRHRRHVQRRTWLYRGSLLAAAAAVVMALFLGNFLATPPGRTPEVANNSQDLRVLYTNIASEVEKFPGRFSSFSPPALDLSVPSFTLPTPDPLDAGMTSIRTLGGTLQGAVEPLERPAKEVYQRVIEIIDEPDVQKWLEKVKKSKTS